MQINNWMMRRNNIRTLLVMCVSVLLLGRAGMHAQSINVFPGAYDIIRPYDGGLFMFKKDGKTGLLKIEDGKERIVCSISADFITDFHDGYAIAVNHVDDGYVLSSIINSDFTVFGLGPKFYVDEYPFFSEGRLPVYCLEYGKRRYGYVDSMGGMVIQMKYRKAGPFFNGSAVVEDNFSSKPFLISADGKEPSVFKKHQKIEFQQDYPQYDSIKDMDTIIGSSISAGLADDEPRLCTSQDGKYFGYEDKNGNEIVPVQFRYASRFCSGLAVVSHDGMDRLIQYVPSKRIHVSQTLDGKPESEPGKEGVRYVVELPYALTDGRDLFLRAYCEGQSFEEKLIPAGNGTYYCKSVVPKADRVVWVIMDGVKLAGQFFPKATPDIFDISLSASKTRVRANSSNKANITFSVANPNDRDITLNISSSGVRPYLKKSTLVVPANAEVSFVASYSGIQTKCFSKITVSSDMTAPQSVSVQLIPYF